MHIGSTRVKIARVGRRGLLTRRRTSELFLLVFVALNLYYFFGSENADWESYREIFQSGAWLALQERDIGFLGLVNSFKKLPDSSYENFRLAIAIYFFCFTIWVLSKWRSITVFDYFFVSLASLLGLFLARFTIQIREGIAITLVIAALTILLKRERLYGSLRAMAPSLVILCIAATIHLGAVIFLFAVLVPQLASGTVAWIGIRSKRAALLVTVGTLLAALAGFYGGYLPALLEKLGSDLYGDELQEVQVDVRKIIYWTVKSFILLYLIARVSSLPVVFKNSPVFSASTRYSVYAILPTLQIAIFYLMFSGGGAHLVSGTTRLYHSIFFVIFGLISLPARKTKVLFFVVTFLLLDEYRVMLYKKLD